MIEADISKGFADVDGQPVPSMLLEAMDATGRWPAVGQLRAWERDRLEVVAGLDVLDVGCGLGDVAIGLAAVTGPGRVVAVDASEGMLAEARRRAAAAGVDVEFRPADAQALPFASGSFDRVRSERTLQWVTEPAQAVAEMARVVRPGGRVVLADTDWRTMTFDHPEPLLAKRLGSAMESMRGAGFAVGGRLANLVREAGLVDLEITAATQVWSDWDPDTEVCPRGMFPVRMMADQLAAAGLLEPGEATGFTDGLEAAARRDRFYASLTMIAVAARMPGT